MKQPACHMGVKARCAPCLSKKKSISWNSSDNWFSPSSQHSPSQLTGIHHGRHNIDRTSHRPGFQQCGGGQVIRPHLQNSIPLILVGIFADCLEFRPFLFTCQPPSFIYSILQAFKNVLLFIQARSLSNKYTKSRGR